jgi:hypothetical protein
MPTCTEPEYTELADDEESPLGMSADDLLAIATPGWEGIGYDVDDAEVDVAWALERGEAARSSRTSRRPTWSCVAGSGSAPRGIRSVRSVRRLARGACARSRSSRKAAAIDHDMDAALMTSQPYWDEQRIQISATEPYEGSGVVVPGIDDSFDTQTIDALLSKGADGRSEGTFSWNGATDTQARAIYLLMWNDYVEVE